MKTEFEEKFCLKYSSLSNGRTVWISEDTPEAVWGWIKLNFISKQKIQTALAETSNWNCKEVLTKLLEDK